MTSAPRSMHRKRRATCLVLCMVISILVAGCNTGQRRQPSSLPTTVLPDQQVTEDANVQVQGIDPETSIVVQDIENESPWELVLRADNAPTDVATALRLAAIDGFLALQDYTSAETQANYLLDVYLSQSQRQQLELQRGRIALGFRQYEIALSYLQPLRGRQDLEPATRATLYQALAGAQLGMGRKTDAIVSLLLRDQLVSDQQRATNQQRIVDLAQTLNSQEQALLVQSAATNGLSANLVPGWLAYAAIVDLPDTERQTALSNWQSSYPGHPADNWLGDSAGLTLDQYGQIAVLLPLTSPYGNAARAFYDGFMEAFNQDTNVYKPAITLHDIGEDPALAAFYYRASITEGAEFVVGPLGRDATTALLQQGVPPLPTLVLADIEPGRSADDLYGISLSPEFEAQQVAARAFADGHRQAAILRSDSSWGNRASKAFADAWQALGGSIATSKSFPDAVRDYSEITQRFLEVSQSEAREQALSASLGINLEFTPRRRDDFDMLFLASNSDQARLLVPQLRFFQAHDLPIYATSNVFNGNNNPAVDADLDSLVFGDMRWLIDIRYEVPQADPTELAADQENDELAATQGVEPADEARAQPVARSAYSFTSLERLYALGFESYNLIPRLDALRQSPWQKYNGQAFRAEVRPDGNIIRILEWATFSKGRVTPVAPVALPEIPAQPGNLPYSSFGQ